MFTSKHFPIDENGNVSATDQLLQKPFLDLNKWSDVATTDCAYYAYEVETLSHSDGVIETDSNQTSIRIHSPYSIDMWANLSALNGIGQSPRKGQEFEDHVMSYREGDILHFDIRLPRKGRYCVDIAGKPSFADDEVREMRSSVLTYTISGSGKKQHCSFPTGMGNKCWGAAKNFTLAGFQVHGLRVPIITTNTGKVTITVSLPEKITPLLCKLRHHTENGSEQLQGHFCGEKKGRKAILTLMLPYKGEYRFTIMARLKKNSESFWEGANYLICNTHPLACGEKFPDYGELWGPNEHFFKLGLHVTGLAVITVENGDHCLTVRKGSDIDLSCDIERNGTKMPTCIFADANVNREEVNFRMRLPEAGFYSFILYAKKKNQTGPYLEAGQWLIDCKSARVGELYPGDRGLWGPNDVFFDLGMKALNLDTSLVIAESGQCSLSFSMPDKTVVTESLERNGVKQDTSLFSEVAIDGTSVTYHMRFRDKGLHVFKLFAKTNGKDGSFPLAGKWVIESRSKWTGPFYPVDNWGPSDHFHHLGLSMERGKSFFIMVNDGKCDVNILAQKPISTTYSLYKGDKQLSETEETKCVEESTDDTSITYRITLPGFGFYKFELYGNVKGQMNLPFLGRWLIERQ